ncbi:MAG: cytochrome c oxidase subunit I, partial [Candidatus Angelobacter sp.]
MSTAVTTVKPVMPAKHYLNDNYGIRSWLLTKDHKRIAILYLVSITFFFFIGGLFAALIRLELLTPQGDLFQSDTYNKLFSMHGINMVFFFLVPSVPATLGNFVLPMMLGAKDLAFPKINLLSWYIYMAGAFLSLATMVSGGVDTGWTFYTPLSSGFLHTHVVLIAVGVIMAGFSSIFTGLNFIVTTHRMRAPGLTWGRLPLFVWSNYATSIIMVLATPVLAITLTLLALERGFHIGIFDPKLGGDPVLFQHMFWFYSHPAVYIMILPAMGVASEVITCFARKRVFGYRMMAYAIVAIASIGFLVWGHHMFVSGQSYFASAVFSFLSVAVAVPSAIKVYNWTATLYKGDIAINAPLLYA